MPIFDSRTIRGKLQNTGVRRRLSRGKERLTGLVPNARRTAGGAGSPRYSRESVPVFFLVGRSKSGTTWMMRILNAHPEILCRGEGRFFGRQRRQEDLIGLQTSEDVVKYKIQPSSLYNAIAESEYLRLWVERSVWSRDDDAEEHLDNLTRLAINYFLTEKLAKTGKRIVGDKTPTPIPDAMREIGRVYPEAKVIHIVRDGRDQAVSMMHHKWNRSVDVGGVQRLEPEEMAKRETYRRDPRELLQTDEGLFTDERLRQAARLWKTRVSKTREDGPALLGDNYAEVKYEDLLERTEEETGRLLEFLGADANPKLVRRCVRAASFEKKAGGRKRGEEDATSGVRKGIAGDWSNVFTERNKRVFKEVAGDLLIELGYEKDYDW